MALFDNGLPCCFCGKPMFEGDNLIGFTMVNPHGKSPLVRQVNDGVVHSACLDAHPQRDEIVAAWNEALGGGCPELEVTKFGHVRYLSWLGRLRYRLTSRCTRPPQRLA
jgi:hypothetical protein